MRCDGCNLVALANEVNHACIHGACEDLFANQTERDLLLCWLAGLELQFPKRRLYSLHLTTQPPVLFFHFSKPSLSHISISLLLIRLPWRVVFTILIIYLFHSREPLVFRVTFVLSCMPHHLPGPSR